MAGNTPHNPIQSTFPTYNHQADPVPRSLNMNFILGAKEGDHAFLFDWVNKSEVSTFEKKDQSGKH